MVTALDERNGLVRVYWQDIRHRVAAVEPHFAKLVDELALDQSYFFWLAYYPWGALTGDTESPFMPSFDGGSYRLSDPNAPREVIDHLGYGSDSAPLAMLLEKQHEFFIDIKNRGMTIPKIVYTPGTLFPLARMLGRKSRRVYAPNGVLVATSGARSVFMLPNIGCATNHVRLQRDFNIKRQAPKNLYEHWHVFKEIVNSPVSKCDWRSCVLYFPHKFVNNLHIDSAWMKLKLYLHELAWQRFEYDFSSFYYDIAFSVIQQDRNLKPNPYLVDTACHLFAIAMGAAPGYVPALDDQAVPLNLLQTAMVDSYGLKKYFATIMQPKHFDWDDDKLPIYYSLQYPSTSVFSPKARKIVNTLFELRELEHIMSVFIEELSRNNNMCAGTVINQIAQNIKLNYFHNEKDAHSIILASDEIPNLDRRFDHKNSVSRFDMRFAGDAPFVRGCISLQARQ